MRRPPPFVERFQTKRQEISMIFFLFKFLKSDARKNGNEFDKLVS